MSPKMLWIYSACLTASFLGFSLGHNSMFEGYDLSLSGYHLCTKTVTVNSSKVVAINVSYTVRVVCGRWLPYKTCPKTFYKTSYKTVAVSATQTITSCCDGYEQVGSYCALPLSRSAMFTARPGSCPKQLKTRYSPCKWDTDCSAGQKCCPDGDQSCCTDARPVGGWRGWWLNMTVFVKTNHTILKTLPGAILNHTRLLHAMVTGALEPQNISVHHIGCHSAGTFRTSTELLIGSVEPLELQTTTAKLRLLQKHIVEVSWVNVQDVNECTRPELNSCLPNAECLNTEGSFNCSCLPGFTDMNPNITGQLCQDVNECLSPELNNCSMNAECFNTEGSYNCSCLPGYKDMNPNITGQLCQDVNECLSPELNNCSSNAECLNTEGSYSCSCLPGYRDMNPNITGQLCQDVNECLSPELNNCSMNAECFNTEGSYICSCLPGYKDMNPNITGQLCQDVNECLSPELNNCSSNAECLNTEGSYSCSCLPGYRDMNPNIIGQLCQDVNECLSPDLNCSLNAECFNTEGSYTCFCLPGYKDTNPNITGQLCQDVNECTSPELNNCSSNAECLNTEGSYNCSCLPGFTDMLSSLPGRYCEDVQTLRAVARLTNLQYQDVFQDKTNPEYRDLRSNIEREILATLSPDLQNLIKLGSVQIQITGFSPGSVIVKFTVVVAQNLSHDALNVSRALISSLQNSSVYNMGSSTIEDLNECEEMKDICSPHANCTNTWASYTCVCREGYKDTNPNRPGHTCVDVNECLSPELNNCSLNDECLNTEGSYYCSCLPGYAETNPNIPGQLCQDVNECTSPELNNCSSNSECLNTEGSYYCSCLPGYTDMLSSLPGRYCEDVQTLRAVARLTNLRYKDVFQDKTSPEYRDLSSTIEREILGTLSPDLQNLIKLGSVQIQIAGFSPGSVIVNFTVVVAQNLSRDALNVSRDLISSLQNSSVYNMGNSTIEDLNECEEMKDICSPHANCTNTWASYTCVCREGYRDTNPNRPGHTCVDVNECLSPELNNCSLNDECLNTEGSYYCSCLPGYAETNPNIPGQLCQDVNECTSPELNNCSSNAECLNTEGSYYCSCLPGYTDMLSSLPGRYCEDVQTLRAAARLTNLQYQDVFQDKTNPEYRDLRSNIEREILATLSPDLQNLIKLGSVQIQITGFSPGSVIVNFTVVVAQNLSRDALNVSRALISSLQNSSVYNMGSSTIEDLNECEEMKDICSPHANCTNTWASYTCVCREGYRDTNPNRPGHTCVDVNECTSPELNKCPLNAECLNTEGSYNCSCLPGYAETNPNIPGQLCQDVNECTSPDLNNCSSNAECLNTEGSYYCSCLPGFTDMLSSFPGRYCEDVQTLRAVARLTNLRYKDVFQDKTSPEYRDLSSTIEREILASLSPDLQNLIKLRSVQIQITGFSPGSTIVDFTVVVAQNLSRDALNVSRALISSFQNSSVYNMGSSTIEDLNECEEMKGICSPHANCTNTWASYTCVCREGYRDTNPNRPGHTCVEAKLTTAKVSSTPLVSSTAATEIITSTGTAATSLKSADTASPITSPAGGIAVECRASAISVTVDKAYLIDKSINEHSLYLGKPDCVVTGRNTSHVQLTAEWEKCGAELQQNNTHNSAQLTLFNNRTSNPGSPKVQLEIPIVCMYRKNILTSTGYSSSDYDLIENAIEGSGTFNVIVQLLNGTDPFPQNYSLSPNEEVVVEVAMINSSMDQIKVVIHECWTTTSRDPKGPDSEYFLKNSCPVPGSYTTVLQNGNSSRSRLAIKVFSFVQKNMVYLHCMVQICLETAEHTCRQDCLERTEKAKKNGGGAKIGVSCGPYFNKIAVWADNEAIQSTQEVIFIIVGVVVGALIAGVLSIVCYRKRRVGHYNFNLKPKPEVLTYNAFEK